MTVKNFWSSVVAVGEDQKFQNDFSIYRTCVIHYNHNYLHHLKLY